ncbi:MAG: secretin N-terminal domain-containing protein [Candidatus Omnitrophota bacterium]|nr:secretin N-terminal domain-containing protein [Candidatus Omnitrophota bacterium]
MKNRLLILACLLVCFLAIGHRACAQDTPVEVTNESNPIISLDYKDADVNAILRSLAWSYGLNLVTSTDVKGKVTINLRNVTLNDALDAILTANGYVHTRRANIIYISSGAAEGMDLSSEPVFLKYLKAAEAQNLLRKVISSKGDIKVDEVSNMLIITDYAASIEKVKKLIQSIDIPPQQVLIEVKIVDIVSKDLQNLGVTYSADYKPVGDVKGLFQRNTRYSEELKGTVTMAGPSSSLSGGQFQLNTLNFKGLSITATIDALVQDQKANLLASPSIAVLNNREARIVIGEKVPYKERTQTTTGTTETTKFIDVGTTLRVTPSINADGYITMMIHPEVSSVTSLLDAGPRITTREADTTVRVKEGETIVLGGLIKQQDDRTRSKIPLLGDLPIIGLLFSKRSIDQSQTELAVFITPRILRSREEAKLYGEKPEEEVYVNIGPTGELSIAYQLFEKADHLDRGIGLESRRKDMKFRKTQALSLFENIASQFPNSPKAPEALWRASQISYKYEHDTLKTRDLLEILISDYPESKYAASGKGLYYKILEEQSEAKDKEISKGPVTNIFPRD